MAVNAIVTSNIFALSHVMQIVINMLKVLCTNAAWQRRKLGKILQDWRAIYVQVCDLPFCIVFLGYLFLSLKQSSFQMRCLF